MGVFKTVACLRRNLDPHLDVCVHESGEMFDNLIRNLACIATHPNGVHDHNSAGPVGSSGSATVSGLRG